MSKRWVKNAFRVGEWAKCRLEIQKRGLILSKRWDVYGKLAFVCQVRQRVFCIQAHEKCFRELEYVFQVWLQEGIKNFVCTGISINKLTSLSASWFRQFQSSAYTICYRTKRITAQPHRYRYLLCQPQPITYKYQKGNTMTTGKIYSTNLQLEANTGFDN